MGSRSFFFGFSTAIRDKLIFKIPPSLRLSGSRGQLKCDGTRAETRFSLSAKRTSPFKSAGASFHSTTGSRGVRISGSNGGSADTPCSEVMWRVLATHSIRYFPLHFPSRASPCVITFQLDSTCYCVDDCLVCRVGWKHQVGFMYKNYSHRLWRESGCVVSPPVSAYVGRVEMNLEHINFHKILARTSCRNQTPKVYDYVPFKSISNFILMIRKRQPWEFIRWEIR